MHIYIYIYNDISVYTSSCPNVKSRNAAVDDCGRVTCFPWTPPDTTELRCQNTHTHTSYDGSLVRLNALARVLGRFSADVCLLFCMLRSKSVIRLRAQKRCSTSHSDSVKVSHAKVQHPGLAIRSVLICVWQLLPPPPPTPPPPKRQKRFELRAPPSPAKLLAVIFCPQHGIFTPPTFPGPVCKLRTWHTSHQGPWPLCWENATTL